MARGGTPAAPVRVLDVCCYNMVTKNKENKRTRVPSPPPRHVSPERVPPQRLRQHRTPTQSRTPRLSIPPQPLARLLNLARAPPLIHRLERRRRRGGERPDDAERPASRPRAHPRLNRLVEPAPKRAPSLAGSFADSQTSRLGGELAVRRRERAIVLEHAQVPGDGGRVRERAEEGAEAAEAAIEAWTAREEAAEAREVEQRESSERRRAASLEQWRERRGGDHAARFIR